MDLKNFLREAAEAAGIQSPRINADLGGWQLAIGRTAFRVAYIRETGDLNFEVFDLSGGEGLDIYSATFSYNDEMAAVMIRAYIAHRVR